MSDAVAAAFAAAAKRIDGVRQALPYEPDFSQGLALPAVTLFWTGFTQDDDTTGPETSNTWTWDVYVRVPLEVGWKHAQTALKQIVAQLLTITRDDPRINGLCDWVTVRDGGPPIFETGENTGYLEKTLTLTARTTER